MLSHQEPGATNIHPADVNGDGDIDFIASRGHGRGVIWFEGPDWTVRRIDDEIREPHSLAVADMDGDGDVDAASCAFGDAIAVWYENDGRGQFSKHLICEMQGAYDIRAMDMDGDMDIDLLIAGHKSQNVVWLENSNRSK